MSFRLPEKVTMADAPRLIEAGVSALRNGEREFDLAAVTECDSSVLACINEWRRHAGGLGAGKLQVTNVPESIRRIARLYGVDALSLG
jgi:ABC-type transporter Mla MlaB component